jgi:acetyl esterase/lipase
MRNRNIKIFYLMLVGILIAIPFWTVSGQGDDEFEPTFPDVRYVEEGDYKHKVDVYLPEDAETPYPTILLFHGNGYTKWDMEPLAQHFVEQGFAAVAVEYRNPMPDFIEDSFCALAWTHTNAETYDFDTDHVFVLGHSMGGFAATVLSIHDEPETFLENCAHTLPEEHRLAGVILYAAGGIDTSAIEDADERAERSALITDQVDGSEPPFLLVHGLNDRLVSSESSEHFASLLEEAEVPTTLVLLDETGHFFIDPTSEPGALAIAAVDEFLTAIFEVEEEDSSN